MTKHKLIFRDNRPINFRECPLEESLRSGAVPVALSGYWELPLYLTSRLGFKVGLGGYPASFRGLQRHRRTGSSFRAGYRPRAGEEGEHGDRLSRSGAA
jgi:hypothetical protein